MSTYIILMTLTDAGIKHFKDVPARIKQVARDLKAAGGKLIGFYTVMGNYDYVAIIEAPSDRAAVTQLMELASFGKIKTTTLKAFATEDIMEDISKSS